MFKKPKDTSKPNEHIPLEGLVKDHIKSGDIIYFEISFKEIWLEIEISFVCETIIFKSDFEIRVDSNKFFCDLRFFLISISLKLWNDYIRSSKNHNNFYYLLLDFYFNHDNKFHLNDKIKDTIHFKNLNSLIKCTVEFKQLNELIFRELTFLEGFDKLVSDNDFQYEEHQNDFKRANKTNKVINKFLADYALDKSNNFQYIFWKFSLEDLKDDDSLSNERLISADISSKSRWSNIDKLTMLDDFELDLNSTNSKNKLRKQYSRTPKLTIVPSVNTFAKFKSYFRRFISAGVTLANRVSNRDDDLLYIQIKHINIKDIINNNCQICFSYINDYSYMIRNVIVIDHIASSKRFEQYFMPYHSFELKEKL